VTARVNDADAARLETILDRSAWQKDALRTSYAQGGWKSFDAGAKPYSADEVQKFRGTYR